MPTFLMEDMPSYDLFHNTYPQSRVADTVAQSSEPVQQPLLLDTDQFAKLELFLDGLTPSTEEEKRTRHIESEHKRRGRIKDELSRLHRLLPEGSVQGRATQAKLLEVTCEYLEQLKTENQRLKDLLHNAMQLNVDKQA